MSLKIAKGQERNEALTSRESTPVCGVLMRKERQLLLLAPFFFSAMTVGTTPQEQSGMGTPIKAALTTLKNEFLPSQRLKRLAGTNPCIRAAMSKPNKNQIPRDSVTVHKLFEKSRSIGVCQGVELQQKAIDANKAVLVSVLV